jgi:ACS family pantothenate transporter-like MFS transporter
MGQLQRKIETFFWGKPPASDKERKLLRKLDMVILSCEGSAGCVLT